MDSLQRDALASLRLTWAPTVDDLWKPQSATHVSGLNEHAVDDVMDAFTDALREESSSPLGVVIPHSAEISVVLPAPLGPSKARISPSSMVSDVPFSASNPSP